VSPLLRIRPLATADIDHAAAYLFEENPAAATSFLESLKVAFDGMRAQPGAGSPRYGHLLPGVTLRMWPLGRFPYLVFYLEHEGWLEVLRVLHQARDLPALLLDEA
jgi:toxin ParE1/3/4